MIGIYRIQNNVNGKVYIGQSIDIKKRWKNHVRDLRKGAHVNVYLQDAWTTYGEKAFSFDVLKKCSSGNLDYFERYYIDQYDSRNRARGYNIAEGPRGRFTTSYWENNKELIVITPKDETHEMCLRCEYDCKQSNKNRIVMCKKIAEEL